MVLGRCGNKVELAALGPALGTAQMGTVVCSSWQQWGQCQAHCRELRRSGEGVLSAAEAQQ